MKGSRASSRWRNRSKSLEQKNTAGINSAYQVAFTEADLPAQVLLHWFINEQIEEEAWADELARPRIRPARGTRWLNCADRSAAEFSGLANGGTEFLLRGEFHGTTSVLRSPFHWHVHPNGTPPKSDNSRSQVPP
ncbi:MAG: hypothetical protein JO232_14035 [Verrucomicrobia bacterium]|nr:hypothetical protein [Verrucomicrobiota bacterium]